MNQCNNDSVVLISSRPRLQGALGAALGAVVAGLALTGGQAKALSVPVTVGGLNYDVTTFTGSYNANVGRFTLTDMPWWGSGDLANQFAAAVGSSSSLPSMSSTYGPFFIFASGTYDGCLSSCEYVKYYIPSGAGVSGPGNWPADRSADSYFATATLASTSSATASVPGPLPILGVAAAFGFSRQLRKRIKSSTNTVPSSSAS